MRLDAPCPARGSVGTRGPIMSGMDGLRRPGPVETLHLYPEERAVLLGLLRTLDEAAWERPTICPGWSVRDVALHLLADDLGILSRHRDQFRPQAPRADEPLGVFLARINDEWVQATRRLSSRVIVDLIEWSGQETYAHWSGLDLMALGSPVSWAGPRQLRAGSTSPVSTPSAGPTSSRFAKPLAHRSCTRPGGLARSWRRSCGRCPRRSERWTHRTGRQSR